MSREGAGGTGGGGGAGAGDGGGGGWGIDGKVLAEFWGALWRLGENPLYRRERRAGGTASTVQWLIVGPGLAYLGFWGVLCVVKDRLGDDAWGGGMIAALTCYGLSMAMAPVLCGRLLAEERDAGVGTSLVLTPYPRTAIVAGALAARIAPLALGAAGCLAYNLVLQVVTLLLVPDRPYRFGDWIPLVNVAIGLAGFLLPVGSSLWIGLRIRSVGWSVALAYVVQMGGLFAILVLGIGLSWGALGGLRGSGEEVAIALGWVAVLGMAAYVGLLLAVRAIAGIEQSLGADA